MTIFFAGVPLPPERGTMVDEHADFRDAKFLQIFITTFSAGIPLTPEGGTIA